MGKSIRCYDYVNHPYEAVRDLLRAEPVSVFRDATKAASERTQTLASELSVNIAGLQVGTDIAISVKGVEEREAKIKSPPMTAVALEWEAARMPGLFPLMKAELLVYPLTSTETQLELKGAYEAPLGVLGGALDAVVGHRVAEASVDRFVKHVAAYLRATLA